MHLKGPLTTCLSAYACFLNGGVSVDESLQILVVIRFPNHSRVRAIYDTQLVIVQRYLPFIFLDGGGSLISSSYLHFDVDSLLQGKGTSKCHRYLETSSLQFRENPLCGDLFH